MWDERADEEDVVTVDAGTWSLGDTEIIARAVVEAPSVHDTQPWNLRLPDHSAELEERLEFAEPGPDPLRVDRLISCGTALANLELAIRVLGNRSRTSVLPDPQRPELIARIETLGSGTPSSRDLRLYAAISPGAAPRIVHRHPGASGTLADVVAGPGRYPTSTCACSPPTRPSPWPGARLRGGDPPASPALPAGDVLVDLPLAAARNARWSPPGARARRTRRGRRGHGHDGIPTSMRWLRRSRRRIGSPVLRRVHLAGGSGPGRRGGGAVLLAAIDARLSASVMTIPARRGRGSRLAEMLDLPVVPLVILRVGF